MEKSTQDALVQKTTALLRTFDFQAHLENAEFIPEKKILYFSYEDEVATGMASFTQETISIEAHVHIVENMENVFSVDIRIGYQHVNNGGHNGYKREFVAVYKPLFSEIMMFPYEHFQMTSDILNQIKTDQKK